MPPRIKKRLYNSEFRQTQAIQTKERVLAAAQDLFQAKGFDKVTVDQIASAAKVSSATIYALFKSKLGILRSLIDTAMTPGRHAEIVRKIDSKTSPQELFAISATIARQLYDAERAQLGLLQRASILDATLKKLEVERENRRYQRQEESLKVMAKPGVLAVDLAKARDILWAFTGRDLYRMLVVERGWSSDEYEAWLAHVLQKILLR